MRRLLLEKTFDDVITEAARKTIEEFKFDINNIDIETTRKLELLGVKEDQAKLEIKKLVDQCQRPEFPRLAKIFENGQFDFVNMISLFFIKVIQSFVTLYDMQNYFQKFFKSYNM